MKKPTNKKEFAKVSVVSLFAGGFIFLIGIPLSFFIIGIPFVIIGGLLMIFGVLGLVASPFVKIKK